MWLFSCLFISISYLCAENKSFVIVTASYNNEIWYQRNLDSVFAQNYDNWRLVYIDDFSTDGTGDLVERYVQEKGFADRVSVICNASWQGHLANQYGVIHSLAKQDIVVILDGDDWFAHDNVLSFLNDAYQDPAVWMTYGQFQFLTSKKSGYCAPIPQRYKEDIRSLPVFIFSHVRTFYAGLFHLINIEDLIYEETFYPRGADMATMYPMIEMAGKHAKFISDVLYVYNNTNKLSFFWTHDHKFIDAQIRKSIREKMPYEPLHKLAFL